MASPPILERMFISTGSYIHLLSSNPHTKNYKLLPESLAAISCVL
jgi:hypothetical protein